MEILVVHNDTDRLDDLHRLAGTLSTRYRITTVSEFEGRRGYDGLILGPGLWHDDAERNERVFQKQLELIRDPKVPTLAICLSALLVNQAFGGETRRVPLRRGLHDVNLADGSTVQVYENHDRAISRMPEGFSALATSCDGVEAMVHDDLPIAAVQFHPEVTEAMNGGTSLAQEAWTAMTLPSLAIAA